MSKRSLLDEVHEFSFVAKCVDVSHATLKNWTFGRPLQVTPSIAGRRGKGSRNLYSTADVYRLAIIKQLVDFGFSVRKLRPVVERLTESQARQFGEHFRFLTLISLGGQLKVDVHRDFPRWAYVDKAPGFDEGGIYILNLPFLISNVRDRLKKQRASLDEGVSN